MPGLRDASRHAPVVVLSPPRSFSSVITAMLGQHPELYGFPELGIFAADTVGGLAAASARSRAGITGPEPARPGLVQAVAELHWGGQAPRDLANARAWLAARPSMSTLDVYDGLLDQIAPLRGVEKSPVTLLKAGALERVTDAYPRARFLHVTRHPVTALRSLEEQFLHWRSVRLPSRRAGRAHPDAPASPPHPWPWPAPAGAAVGQAVRVQCAAIWLVAHERALALAGRRGAARVLRVRGEDVLTEPAGSLELVARWLGIRADASALAEMRHPERSPYARGAGRDQPGGLDRKFVADPTLRPCTPAPAGEGVVPDGWELAETLVSRIRSMAGELGYRHGA